MLSFLSLTHAAPAQYIRRDIWASSPQSFALLTEEYVLAFPMLYALTYKYLVARLSTRLLGTCVYAISLLLY